MAVSSCQTPVLTVIGGVKTTNVADAADPLVHLFFGVSHQVEDTVDGLDVEYEAVLQVLLIERQPSVHLRGQQTGLTLIWHQSIKTYYIANYSQSNRN